MHHVHERTDNAENTTGESDGDHVLARTAIHRMRREDPANGSV